MKQFEEKSKANKIRKPEVDEKPNPMPLFKKLYKRYKSGRVDLVFYDGIVKLMMQLSSFEISCKDQIKKDSDLYIKTLRMKALIAEGLYWLGHYDEFVSVLEQFHFEQIADEIKHLADEIKHPVALNHYNLPDVREILREKCRLTVSFALLSHRRNDCKGALKLLLNTKKVIESLITGSFACHGSQGQVTFYLGIVSLKLDLIEDAEKYFYSSIEHYVKRVEFKNNEYRQKQEDNGESSSDGRAIALVHDIEYSRTRTGIVLGCGRSQITKRQGLLEVALNNNVRPAFLLVSPRDPIHTSLLLLHENCLIRSLYCDQEEQLNKVILKLGSAREVFRRLKHQRYEYRAIYESVVTEYYLLKIYIEQNRKTELSDSTFEKLKLLKEFALSKGDNFWHAQYLHAEALIYMLLNNFEVAESRLTKGIENISQVSSKDENKAGKEYLIKLYVTRSRTYMELKKYDLANQDLESATTLNNYLKSDSSKAIITFERARLNIRKSNLGKAKKDLQEGRLIIKGSKEKALEMLAEEVRSELQALVKNEFIFSHSNLKLDDNEKEFRAFLINYALKENDYNIDAAAAALGINKATLYRIRKETEND